MSGIPQRGYGSWKQWKRRCNRRGEKTGSASEAGVYAGPGRDNYDYEESHEWNNFLMGMFGKGATRRRADLYDMAEKTAAR